VSPGIDVIKVFLGEFFGRRFFGIVLEGSIVIA